MAHAAKHARRGVCFRANVQSHLTRIGLFERHVNKGLWVFAQSIVLSVFYYPDDRDALGVQVPSTLKGEGLAQRRREIRAGIEAARHRLVDDCHQRCAPPVRFVEGAPA